MRVNLFKWVIELSDGQKELSVNSLPHGLACAFEGDLFRGATRKVPKILNLKNTVMSGPDSPPWA